MSPFPTEHDLTVLILQLDFALLVPRPLFVLLAAAMRTQRVACCQQFEEFEYRSVLLESLAGEFQGAAVFGDCPDYVVWCARRYSGLDLNRDGDFRTDQADEMGDDLIGDPAGVASDSSWINDDRAVEALRCTGNRPTRSGAISRGNGLTARTLPSISSGRGPRLRCGVDSLLTHGHIRLNDKAGKAIDPTD
jgi:hypothetical protein